MIGIVAEADDLQRAYDSDQSEFVAVYGRRRVGKTFLINEFFHGKYSFHVTGQESGGKREQLESFWEALKKHGLPKCRRPQTWISAFSALEDLLAAQPPLSAFVSGIFRKSRRRLGSPESPPMSIRGWTRMPKRDVEFRWTWSSDGRTT